METAKVTFSNGDTITTGINGTDNEIREYYAIGREFNLGDGAGGDLMATVISCKVGGLNDTIEDAHELLDL